jgi:hypothetical protein
LLGVVIDRKVYESERVLKDYVETLHSFQRKMSS